jgi:hypothetical protein
MEHEDILEKLAESSSTQYSMHIDDIQYQIQIVSFMKSKIPVRKPTTRGGVYFTDVEAYKIRAKIPYNIIRDEIHKLMLGPNTDFKPILVKTSLNVEGKNNLVILTTHLTNTANTKEMVELNLIVDKVELK